MKLVCGVGNNDWNSPSYINRKMVWQYQLWSGIINRCFNEKLKEKHPTYKNVSCCNSWLYMSNFVKDISKIENSDKYESDGWEMDKDILFKGNKIYSPETVCFVPIEINLLLTKSDRARGEFPIGVHYNKRQRKFTARVRKGVGNHKTLGVFFGFSKCIQCLQKSKRSIYKGDCRKMERNYC